MAQKLVSIRIHGQGTHKYDNVRIGLNARLDTLQAAILIPKLEVFPKELEARQRIAEKYSALLSAFAGRLSTPHIPSGLRSAWAQYSILTENSESRAMLQQALRVAGIPTAVYYPKPLHFQPAFRHLEYKAGDFPVSEDFSRRIFSLPMHPYLEDKQIDRIVGAMKKAL
jgi:UDP-2-acetamido-2-deoxy-ribo-hexuluronate aminotransferase